MRQDLLRADRGTLFVLDAVKGVLWSKVAEGHDTITVPLHGRSIAAAAARRGARVVNVAQEAGQLSFVETCAVLDAPPADLGWDTTIAFYNLAPATVYDVPEADVDADHDVYGDAVLAELNAIADAVWGPVA